MRFGEFQFWFESYNTNETLLNYEDISEGVINILYLYLYLFVE